MPEEEREIEKDLEATIEARRDLGPAYESELVQSFVERIDATIERRVEAEVAERRGELAAEESSSGESFIVALVSLGTGIPITAIASNSTAGMVTAWAGIVGVNAAFAWGRRRRR